MKELSKIHHRYPNSEPRECRVEGEVLYIYIYTLRVESRERSFSQQILGDGKLKRILRDEADDEVVIVEFRMADLFRAHQLGRGTY